MPYKTDGAGNFFVGYPSDSGRSRFYNDIFAAVSACYGANALASSGPAFASTNPSSASLFRFEFRPTEDSLSGTIPAPANSTVLNSGSALGANARLGVVPFSATPELAIRATNGSVLYYEASGGISNYPSKVMCTLNAKSACFYGAASSTHILAWVGNLSNIQASASVVYPETCSILVAHTNTATAVAARTLSDSTSRSYLTSGAANYSVTCADSQAFGSNLWATDLFLRDNNAITSNAAIGKCDNLLLARGVSFVLGNYYRINTLDISGASPLFICAANFGTDKILMRIKEA